MFIYNTQLWKKIERSSNSGCLWEKLIAGNFIYKVLYIPCCPFYIMYHVPVLQVRICFIKTEVEAFLLRWKNTKDILLSVKSKLQNSMESIWFYFCKLIIHTYMYVYNYTYTQL